MTEEPSFDIPSRPERRYPPSGGVEYEGETVFDLTPRAERSTAALDELLGDVLAPDRYVRGNFFDLPSPAYLVHDGAESTSFRVVVRDGRIELHVLPDTDAAGLEALYRALANRTDHDWRVECRTSEG